MRVAAAGFTVALAAVVAVDLGGGSSSDESDRSTNVTIESADQESGDPVPAAVPTAVAEDDAGDFQGFYDSGGSGSDGAGGSGGVGGPAETAVPAGDDVDLPSSGDGDSAEGSDPDEPVQKDIEPDAVQDAGTPPPMAPAPDATDAPSDGETLEGVPEETARTAGAPENADVDLDSGADTNGDAADPSTAERTPNGDDGLDTLLAVEIGLASALALAVAGVIGLTIASRRRTG